MKKRVVEFFRHNLGADSIKEFEKTAKTLFLTTGPKTAEFEKEFASYLGIPHAVGSMSCTHALHLAYRALGIGKGDEVIVPAFTFVASVTSIIHAGATPVFVDVKEDTCLIDIEQIEKAITKNTKAILPVHLYGVMVDMIAVSKIAKKNNLFIVEDAAHCIEGKGEGYSPGSHSDAVAFSFYATKNITCGEGGAMVTSREEVADKVRTLANHGLSKSAVERFGNGVPSYDVKEVGYKSNMNDLQAAMLIPQLKVIETQLLKRKNIVSKYMEEFKEISGIILPTIPSGTKSAHHLFTLRCKDASKRDELITALKEEGVNCSINYKPLSSLTLFNKELGMKEGDFPVADKIGNSILTLPLYPSLEDDEVAYVTETFKKVAEKVL